MPLGCKHTNAVDHMGLASRFGATFALGAEGTLPNPHQGHSAQLALTPGIDHKYLQRCISGDCIVAIAMTEPGTGSDLQGIKTSAVDMGDHYLLNGSKTFITCGQQADIVLVVCRTDPDPKAGAKAVSILIVERDMPGFERGRNLEQLGPKVQDTSELFFHYVKVPTEDLQG